MHIELQVLRELMMCNLLGLQHLRLKLVYKSTMSSRLLKFGEQGMYAVRLSHKNQLYLRGETESRAKETSGICHDTTIKNPTTK